MPTIVAHAIMHVPITLQQTPHQTLARLVFVNTHATAVTQIAVASQHQAFDASKQQICKRMVKIAVLVAKSAVQAKPVSAANVFRTAVLVRPLTFALSMDRTSARKSAEMTHRTAAHAITLVPTTLRPMLLRTHAKMAFANTHATRDIRTVVVRQHQASTV